MTPLSHPFFPQRRGPASVRYPSEPRGSWNNRVVRVALGLQLLIGASISLAENPGMINFQGRVTVRGTDFDGIGQFKFALVDRGRLISLPPLPPRWIYRTYWSHDGTSQNGNAPTSSIAVAVSKGLYSVMLGDTGIENMSQSIPAAVFTNTGVYLRVWFDDGTNGVQQVAPDQRIGSVAYALQAAGADAGAITTAMIADGAVTGGKIGPGAVTSMHVDDGGTAAYEGFLDTAKSLSTFEPPPFEALSLVSSTNSVAPAFTFALGGSPFGTVEGFVGREGISEPYEYVVEVVAPGAGLDPDAQIGRAGRLSFARNTRTSAFDGIISACSVSSRDGTNALYTFRIEPPLAYLGLSTDYRVFQEQTVPEVVSSVYLTLALRELSRRLSGDSLPRDSIIQYDETALDFISRLLEDEGIFYLFDLASSPPELVLGDDQTAYRPSPSSPFPYFGQTARNVPPALEYIRNFQKAVRESTKTSTLATRDFTRPSLALRESISSAKGRGERYEFGASAIDSSSLQLQARSRQQRHEVERATLFGAGNAPDLRAGYTFTLDDRTDSGLGNTYLVTAARHAGFRRMTNGTATLHYGNQFEVIPASLVYRPAMKTRKPRAQACTADVTGPAGEQIHVDQYGRVKVRFHWDRVGANDDRSSAWIPVATPMAGASHGMLFLPRVGDEVLVDFLHGDPDRPVIVGSLYNGNALPPNALPAQRWVGAIRSESAAGGVNEIRFDDTAGSEFMAISSRNLLLSTPLQEIRVDDTAGEGAMELTTRKLVLATPQVLIDGSEYTRSNSVVAWARVAANGSVSGTAYGVAGVTNPREGSYAVTLVKNMASASVVIPVAVPEVNAQPTSAATMRFVTVDQVQNNAFNVFVMSGLGAPTNSPFLVIVTGR